MNGWKSLPVALHPRLAKGTLLGLIRPTAECGSLAVWTVLLTVPFSVLFSTRTVFIGRTSVKFGSTKQLVSRNEAAAAGKMIYTTTTWRCSSLFLVDDWGWNIEMLWRADHQYLPCALCVVLPLIPMRCHGMFTTKVLVPLLLLSFCFELWRAHVSKCQQNCETLWLLETLATCSNASFCFVEIGRVGCFSPLAHVFHIHGPAEQAEKGDSKASSHFFNIRVSMDEKNMLFSWGCIPELYVQKK